MPVERQHHQQQNKQREVNPSGHRPDSLLLFAALVRGVNADNGDTCNDEDNHGVSHTSPSGVRFSTTQVNVNDNECTEKKQCKVVRNHLLSLPTSKTYCYDYGKHRTRYQSAISEGGFLLFSNFITRTPSCCHAVSLASEYGGSSSLQVSY